jgi:hypothetical protein
MRRVCWTVAVARAQQKRRDSTITMCALLMAAAVADLAVSAAVHWEQQCTEKGCVRTCVGLTSAIPSRA